MRNPILLSRPLASTAVRPSIIRASLRRYGCAALMATAGLVGNPLRATDTYFIRPVSNGQGDWFSDPNWSAGHPNSSIDAYINQTNCLLNQGGGGDARNVYIGAGGNGKVD